MADPLDEFLDAARTALPPVEGELAVAGLREPVEVLRDGWGIPYLSAASLESGLLSVSFMRSSEPNANRLTLVSRLRSCSSIAWKS